MGASCTHCTRPAPAGKTVQIRDLPDDVHRELRVRAARAGLSLAEHLRREVTAVAHRPSVDAPCSSGSSPPPVTRAPRRGQQWPVGTGTRPT